MKTFLQVGETDEYGSVILEAVASDDGCEGCYLKEHPCPTWCGMIRCDADERPDGVSIILKQVRKKKECKPKEGGEE